MLTDELKEVLTERLVKRIEKINLEILTDIGKRLDEIRTLTPTDQFKLANILNYGGDYRKIVKELERTTTLNSREIEEIISKVAENNYVTMKDYYDMKNIGFIPYARNEALRKQVDALKKLTKDTLMNFSRTKSIGFTTKDRKGNVIFKDISNTYKDAIDEAVLAVYQGKDNFDKVARKIIRELGGSGLKYVDYESGMTRRLDSAVRMNIEGAIRDLENLVQEQIAEETDSDGIEISVHEYPAVDHEPIQGHQFDLENYRKMQNSKPFKDVRGVSFEAIKRHIGEYNCYHNIFAITIGINEPIYSQKQLDEIIKRNQELTEIDGKKYTKYECTQLQRKLETEIRKEKDIQVMARSANQRDVAEESQIRINQLTRKYNEISKKAGIPTRKQRFQVAGYNKIKVINEPKTPVVSSKPKLGEYQYFVSKEDNEKLADFYINGWSKENGGYHRFFQKEKEWKELKEKGFKDEIIDLSTTEGCNKLLEKINGTLHQPVRDTQGYDYWQERIDPKLRKEIVTQVYKSATKNEAWLRYSLDNYTVLTPLDLHGPIAQTDTRASFIDFDLNYYENSKWLEDVVKAKREQGFFSKGKSGTETLHPVTHEIGHIIHGRIADEAMKPGTAMYENFKYVDKMLTSNSNRYNAILHELIDIPINRVAKKLNIDYNEVIRRYVSGYGTPKGTNIVYTYEMFAETFADGVLGGDNPLAKELINYLKEIGQWS